LDSEKKKFEEQMQKDKQKVSIESVYDVVSNMTNIPITKMNVDDNKLLLNLDKSLIDKVIGQNDAVIKIAKSIKRNQSMNNTIRSIIDINDLIRIIFYHVSNNTTGNNFVC
jgi:ATP-dependent Clp protease ATP-binding subunit ClpC